MEYRTQDSRITLFDNGEELGEVTFPETSPGVFTIDHTFIDNRLRGQGIASELVRRAVEEIEGRGGEVEATCSYAILWLSRNRERDISKESLSCPLP